jgi:predicted dehydrogenase
MVGGGTGAFIGAVHRAAAALDGKYELCAGAMSSEPERARQSGRDAGIPDDRAYGSWREMVDGEANRSQDERVELVSIVTPNATHHEIARAFIDAGFHVLIDKPMTTTVEDARDLVSAVDGASVIGAVMYTYSGYPLVREMADMVRDGAIGTVRRVYVEYHQGWLATPLEREGQKQASWRADPKQAGAGGAIGDIGTHAEHLLRFVTGLEIESLLADLTSFVPGRALDDDAAAMLRLSGGARATLTASQVCVGEENNLSIRVHGETGSLAWRQESPNELDYRTLDGARRVITRGSAGLGGRAQSATRLPTGHPEGFIEAFANIYKDVADAVVAHRAGTRVDLSDAKFPTVHNGLRGVEFVERMTRSASTGGWV